MPPRRIVRPDMPSDAQKIRTALQAMRECRERLGAIIGEVRDGCRVDVKADAVNEAIIVLGTELTGDRDYFLKPRPGSNADALQAEKDKLARERGELPWKFREPWP